MNGQQQSEIPQDPTTQAVHRVLAKVYGDNGAEVDPSFAELKKKSKMLKLQDLANNPIVQEASGNNETAAIAAIRCYPGFYIRSELIKQHHDFLPQNAILLRDMPVNYSNAQILELFQSLVLEDGSACPVPLPDKMRSDGNSWLVVFASVEEASKALIVVRNKSLTEGKNIRAVQRNETARVQSLQTQHKRDQQSMPMMYNQHMNHMSPAYAAPMYGPSTIISGQPPMYYPAATAGSPQYPFYSPFQHPAMSPYAMSPYGMQPMHFGMPQSPYGAPQQPYYEMSMYGMQPGAVPPVSAAPVNNYNNTNGNGNNNNNKPRRTNNNQYSNNTNSNNGSTNNNNYRPNSQARPRDPNQPYQRYQRNDEAMQSPSVMANEVAAAALDSNTGSVPRSFSGDAEDNQHAQKQHDVYVPVISVPTSESSAPIVDNSPAVVSDASASPAVAAEEAGKDTVNGEATSADADATAIDKNARGNNGARRDGKRGDGSRNRNASGKDGDNRRNNNGRDNNGKGGNNRQDKDAAAKKERKTPPVNLSLEKDFPTLNLGENAKVSGTGKTTVNYANALKKASDESPTASVPPVAKASTPQPPTSAANGSSNNTNSNSKRESRSSSKAATPNPAATTSTSTQNEQASTPKTPAAPAPAKKAETATVAPAAAAAAVVKAPPAAEKKAVAEAVTTTQAAVAPAVETPVVEAEQPAGGRKISSFLDAVRAKK